MDTNKFQKEATCAFKVFCDKTRAQKFVFFVVEFALPILLVLSLLGCIILSFVAAFAAGGFFGAIFAFLTTLIGSIVGVCFTFYFIYAVKAIKDSLVGATDYASFKEATTFGDVANAKAEEKVVVKKPKVVKEPVAKKEPVKKAPAKKAPAKKAPAKKPTTEVSNFD